MLLATAALGAPVDVRTMGAKCDGVTVDTTALQNAITTAREILIPKGVTCLTNTLTMTSGTTIVGEGPTSVLKQNTTSGSGYGTLHADSGSSSAYVTNITLRDFKLLGQVTTAGFSDFIPLLSLGGVKDVVIDHVVFEGFRGDGFLLLGQAPGGVGERHNKNVTVRSSLFDGLNNDNRNGISVIDVDGMLIEGSLFQNCARSTMPGSLDLEPDQSFGVIKNVRVISNRFLNTDGNRGHIAISTQATANVENIIIAHNHFEDAGTQSAIVMNLKTANPTVPLGFVIEGNTAFITGGNFVYKRDGNSDGVTIKGNIARSFRGVWFSNAGAVANDKNLSIEGNTFYPENTGFGIILSENVSYVSIKGNIINGTPNKHIQIGANGTSEYVSIVGNDFIGVPASTDVITHLSTAKNPHTNVLADNRFEAGASNLFAATRSDYADGALNIAAFTDTPATFAPGTHWTRMSAANGPTGVSDVGELLTRRLSRTDVDTYQIFIPQYNAPNRSRIYLRKATAATTWTEWFMLAAQKEGTATFDPPNLAGGATQQTTVTVANAETGDYCTAAHSQVNADIVWLCSITAAATATVTQWNRGAGAVDLASGTLRARATKQ